VEVTVVGVDIEKEYALCSRGVKIIADINFSDDLKAVSLLKTRQRKRVPQLTHIQ
jgi:hypothetical protein